MLLSPRRRSFAYVMSQGSYSNTIDRDTDAGLRPHVPPCSQETDLGAVCAHQHGTATPWLMHRQRDRITQGAGHTIHVSTHLCGHSDRTPLIYTCRAHDTSGHTHPTSSTCVVLMLQCSHVSGISSVGCIPALGRSLHSRWAEGPIKGAQAPTAPAWLCGQRSHPLSPFPIEVE